MSAVEETEVSVRRLHVQEQVSGYEMERGGGGEVFVEGWKAEGREGVREGGSERGSEGSGGRE